MITYLSTLLKRIFGKKQSPASTDGVQENRRDRSPKSPLTRQAPPPLSPDKKKPAPRVKKPQWTVQQFEVPAVEGKSRFHDFRLPAGLMHAVADLDFQYCMPVQAETLPHALEGKDLTAKAQTGTGKTAAFLITILARLLRNPAKGKRKTGSPRALILAPTRELVLQIQKDAQALSKYIPVRIVSVFGGMDYQKQKNMLLEKPVDIVAATPGRLIDYLRQNVVHLDTVEILVIDEADRMLDMGFIPDVRRIIYATPHKETRQTLFFSATLSPEILRMAGQWTRDSISVEIDPETTVAESVNQKVYIVTEEEKFILLVNLVEGEKLDRVILFVNRRDATRFLASKLDQYDISCDILSGEVSQTRRIRTLETFRKGKIRILVATDVAARGLHIEGVSHVVNYDLPQDPEHYIHRIGRTGRAGADGISVSFADEMSSFYIPEIEKVIGNRLECEYPSAELLRPLPPPKKPAASKRTPHKKTHQSRSRSQSGRRRPPRRRNPVRKTSGPASK